MAGNLVREAAQRTGSLAEWLNARDPGSVLDEVKSFARRRPGAFIAIAAVAGVAVGRADQVGGGQRHRIQRRACRGCATPDSLPGTRGTRLRHRNHRTNEYSDIRDVTP